MAKKQSALVRHRKRLQQQIRRAESRGYTFDAAFKEKVRSSGTVQELSHWRGEYIYKHAAFRGVDPITGEIVELSGPEGRKWERSAAARKREQKKLDNIVIQNVLELLGAPGSNYRSLYTTELSNRLSGLLIQSIQTRITTDAGRHSVAESLRQRTDDIEECVNVLKYDSDAKRIEAAYSRMLEIISSGILPDADFRRLQEAQDDWEGWEEDDWEEVDESPF